MTTWDKIFRQIALRGNQLNSGNATTLQAAYTAAAIGQTQMDDKAVHFPKEAIDDAVLNACDVLVGAIGRNRHSDYRVHFRAASGNIASGDLLPMTAADNVTPRIGAIGEVYDQLTGTRLTAKPYQTVMAKNDNSFVKSMVCWYFSDDTRIWHTCNAAVIDLVVWNKETARTAMNTTPTRGVCPFPEELHEAIVTGSLSYMFRQNFNTAQVGIWRGYFESVVARLEAEPRLKTITQE